jgi:alpha-tubulin suppressor-like RCC1 family protein
LQCQVVDFGREGRNACVASISCQILPPYASLQTVGAVHNLWRLFLQGGSVRPVTYLRLYFSATACALLWVVWGVNPVWAAVPAVTLSTYPTGEGVTALALSSTGQLVGWGADTNSQLGQGRTLRSATALQVGSGYQSVSVGESYLMAVKADGSLWAWGDNTYSQLGDGSNSKLSAPGKVGDGYQHVVAGYGSTYGLKTDGSLWMWGQGIFGDGSPLKTAKTPTQISTAYAEVATGGYHVLALKRDGKLEAWGPNASGELGVASSDVCNPGISSYTCALSRMEVGTGFKTIAAGADFSFGIKTDTTLWAWGNNGSGQLGDGSTATRAVPTLVGSGYASVAAGSRSAVALKTDGSLWSWGAGSTDPATGQPATRPVKRGEGFASLALGGGNGFALKADQTLWAWGDNEFGAFGDGSTQASVELKQVQAGVLQVAAGALNASYIKTDGSLWVAGDNRNGQLGQGELVARTSPVLVGGGYATVANSSDGTTTWATKADGSLWAWGKNAQGQYGDGTRISSATPVQVRNDLGYTAVSGGGQHAVSVNRNSGLAAWGQNSFGQLGLGASTPFTDSPKEVGSGYQAVAAGLYFTVALKVDGSVWTFGSNTTGALGITTSETCGTVPYAVPCASAPQQVGTGFTAIAAGPYHVLALKADGTLWAWGDNTAGQLGVASADDCYEGSNFMPQDNFNTAACSRKPLQVGAGFTAISAGYQHSLALKADGSLWGWGTNYWGYLGNGQVTGAIFAPQQVGMGYTAVAAGGYASVATKADGTVLAWGQNNTGSLGDGTLVNRLIPSLVINETANGLLDLRPEVPNRPLSSEVPPFFVVAAGGIGSSTATVSTTTTFNPSDLGKAGAVFVTASVPVGSFGIGVPASGQQAKTTAPSTLVVQLTGSGWRLVTNNVLIPYISGILGGQLSGQTILNKVDISGLKGAAFCVGYGTTAQEMLEAGRIRTVATIPATAGASPVAPSCTLASLVAPNSLNEVEFNCLFDWAEDQFPASLQPRRPATQTLSPYRYRSYTAQNMFVAYSAGDAHLYFLAAPAPVVDLGLAAGWSRQAGCRP